MVDEIDEPKPQPVQQSGAMTPEQAKGWEVWCRSVIADELHIRPFTEFQIDTIAGFVCEHVRERIDALKTEIGQLRADIEVLRQHRPARTRWKATSRRSKVAGMPHEQDNVRIIHDALCGFSTDDRLTALVVSIVESDPRALAAVLNLIDAVGMMARCLTPAQRLAVCWGMLEEIEKIGAKWN